MKTSKTTPWVVGAAFAAVVILGLAWVLGVSPQLESAQQSRDEASGVRAQNLVHAQRLAELQEQFEHLDEYKAELAEIRVQIPTEDGEPALIREVQAGVTAAAVFLVSLVSDVPEAVVPQATTPGAAQPTPAPTEGATTEGGEAAGGESAPGAEPATPTEVPSIPGFVAVPFSVTVLGPFSNGIAFIDLAQTMFDRLFVVTQFKVTGQQPTPASGGRPEIREGDYETLVSGYVFVLPETEQAPTESTGDPAAGEVVDA